MNTFLLKFVKNNFKKPGKTLDLGSGASFDVACLKSLNWKAVGVDKKTGTDLEKKFLSAKTPFDLVFSNYVLHFIKNKKVFIQSAFDNLKVGGYFFLHTFDSKDKTIKPNFTKKNIEELMAQTGFKEIRTTIIPFYDNEPGHRHWHRILQITAKK